MKLTNKWHLPQPIVDAVRNDPYSKGDADYSVTQLIKSARISQLEKEHWNDLEEDVVQRLPALYGQILHGILERAERTALAEKRYYATVAGKRISGATDRLVLEDKKLQDYKLINFRKIKNGVPFEFEAQLNIYVYLLRENGLEVEAAELQIFLRDWDGFKREEDGYPIIEHMAVPVRIWPAERTYSYLVSRVEAHEGAKQVLPRCNPQERWQDADVFAVMAPTRKRAVKLCKTEAEASALVAAFTHEDYYIEYRPGKPKRCLGGWCRVSHVCSQFQEELKNG